MSSEERLVRPYQGLDRIQHALRTAYLQVGTTHIEPGKSATFTPGAYLTSRAVVHFARDDEEFEQIKLDLAKGIAEAGFDPALVGLRVVLTTGRLKRSSVAFSQSMADLNEMPMAVLIADAESRPDELSAPYGGCRVDVFVRLDEELPREVLRAWRLGTWLGHARFNIGTDLGDVGFTPVPLTDAIRAELGLPKGTLRYVHIDDPFAVDVEDALRLYLDEQLFASLMLRPTSQAALLLQRQMYLDAVTAIVYASADAFEDNWSLAEIEGSILDRLINRLAGSRNGKGEEALKKRRGDFLDEAIKRPRIFLARVEDLLDDLRHNIEAVLSGGEA